MFKRKIYDRLLEWKNQSSRKALCIIGARQVGKTTIVREFAKNEYEQLIELNFLTDEKAREVFDGSLNGKDLLLAISAYANKPILPGQTLVLLDEVQACPRARTAVKFLVEEGTCDYIETGSMLGVNLEKVESYPVGFEEIIYMYPMDFQEFVWANNLPANVLDHLKQCFKSRTPVNPTVHDTMIQTFQRYIVVGGMPEIVRIYLNTNDISRVTEHQLSLLQLYRNDITKYAKIDNRGRITEIFEAIPSQLNEKNRRFKISQVFPRSRLQYLEDSFNWLTLAGISLPCFNVDEPAAPLKINERRNLFQLYFFDTGLLCAMIMNNAQSEILKGNLEINQGSILENVFACELKAHGYNLYYYNSKKIGEIDFLLEEAGRIQPLEIKSGKNWTSHTALNNLLRSSDWTFFEPMVYCKGNLTVENGITYMPWYMVMYSEYKPVSETVLDALDFESLSLLDL